MYQIKSRHLIIFLMMINFMLGVLWFGGERIIKLQSGDFRRNYVLLEKIMPASYMEYWVDSILSDLFTVSSRTLDRKDARFKKYSSENEDFSGVFKEIKDILKTENIKTAFFPETFSVDKKNKRVHVTGTFLTHDAEHQKTTEETKTFVLDWQILPDGRTVVRSITQEKGGIKHEQK